MRRSAPALLLEHMREGFTVPAGWRLPLAALALAWLGLAVALFDDWAAIAAQAWNVSTYNHILLIPAILFWLVFQRREEVAGLTPRPWLPALAFCAGATFLWLLGALSGLDTARQLGAVLLLISAVPLLLGVRISATLLFPLVYALMLVPFGDEMVPALQTITATLTIALIRVSEIPATIDGVFIDTPAGLFEVAEACSGVKFLVAMIAFGLLVGNVCFVSWKRRIAFFAVCIVVPILANGVRAWATIMVAQIVGATAAVRFDHIVYGWIFFGIVIAAVIAGAWRWFDRPADAPLVDAGQLRDSALIARLERCRIALVPALLCFAAIVAGGQVWAHTAEKLAAPLPAQIALPDVPGWERAAYQPHVPWQPLADGAEHRLLGRYRDAQGREVDVFVALYSAQGDGREAGGFGQGAMPPDGRWSWLGHGPAIADGMSERLLADGHVERLALTWYRTGGVLTDSNVRLKLANMADRLTLTARPTAMLIVSAESGKPDGAEASVRAFVASVTPIDAWMDRVAGME